MFFCTLLSGMNHTLQTSLTAALALDVDIIGNLLDRYENYFVLFCTFLGGAIPIIFRECQGFGATSRVQAYGVSSSALPQVRLNVKSDVCACCAASYMPNYLISIYIVEECKCLKLVGQFIVFVVPTF